MATGRSTTKLGCGWGALAMLIATLAGGCVVSPQPSPPYAPTLDGSRIGEPEVGPTSTAEYHGLAGKPGTVDPPRGLVVVTNLDTQDAPTLAEVGEDGGFFVSVRVSPGDALRFQVKQDDARSQPVDLTFGEPPASVAATPDALPCLEVEPSAWLSLGADGEVREVVVRNTCLDEVAMDAPRLRRGGAPLSVTPAAGVSVAAGDSARFTVRAGGTGEEREDVLLLDITRPAVVTRAVTVTLPD